MHAAIARLRHEGALEIVGAIAWIVVVQFICTNLFDLGFLTRMAGLIHWLGVGVLPASLALARLPRPAP